MAYTPLTPQTQEPNARPSISQFLQDRFAQLIVQTERRVSGDIDAAVVAASSKARRAANEEMNQIMRRLRQCPSTDEIAAWLVDSTSPYASQAALFEIAGTRLRGVRSRGFPAPRERFELFEIPLDRAPAFAHSAQERDTVVAIGSASEVSPEVVAILGHASDEKVYLYPVVIEGKTVAVLYATAGGPGRQFVDGAALELLTQAAASAAQILSSELAEVTPPATRAAEGPVKIDLINIEGIKIEGIKAPAKTQSKPAVLRHAKEARARLYARSAVAAIRLKKKNIIGKARTESDIYGALKPEIDAARKTYERDFLVVSPVIVDYLDKELLKLAHDEASLLGPDYPGSLL